MSYRFVYYQIVMLTVPHVGTIMLGMVWNFILRVNLSNCIIIEVTGHYSGATEAKLWQPRRVSMQCLF